MIGVIHKRLKDIPVLEVVQAQNETKALPTMIYFHGFTSAKEHNLPLAYRMAERGFRVLLPDSALHGERERDVSPEERQLAFWDIVMQNVKELGQLYHLLNEQSLLLDGRIGIAGTSMGGITTTAALTQYTWIKTAAVLMGTPKLTDYATQLVEKVKQAVELPVSDAELTSLFTNIEAMDLSRQPNKLNERPVLFWHGEQDPVIPIDQSYSFYEQAKQVYEQPEHLQFIKEKNRGHKVSRQAILNVEEWFCSYL